MTDSARIAAPMLVADIGGTNARFSLASPEDYTLTHQHSFKCSDFSSLAEVIHAWQNLSGQPLPRRACFAIAGPIDNGHVKMTNLSWEFSCQSLKSEFDIAELHLINDFAALANAAAVLQGDDLHCLKQGSAANAAPLAIIGPGTGFGAAALVPNKDKWITLASEGGHAAFAPTTEIERQLLEILSQKYTHVSIETLLCGRGLVDIYQSLAQLQQQAANNYCPSDITKQAVTDGDNLCVQTVETFCNILGSVAADKALTYGARGGVFIGGGIVPRLLEFIKTTHFQAHFVNKGVMSHYVEDIPVHVMIADQPALIGAAAWLQHQAD